jgi:hypothetical protein
MFPLPSLSSYLPCGVVIALLAITVFETSFGLTTANQFPRRGSHAIAEHAFSKVPAADVNRSRKGDRLPMALAQPVTNTTIVQKNAVPPEQTVRGAIDTPVRPRTPEVDDGNLPPKLAPAPALDCETASADSDPNLGRFMGSCIV